MAPLRQKFELFTEPTDRVLVSVGREDDVKFVGLCEALGIKVMRIGVAYKTGQLVIEDVATWQLINLYGMKNTLRGALWELNKALKSADEFPFI